VDISKNKTGFPVSLILHSQLGPTPNSSETGYIFRLGQAGIQPSKALKHSRSLPVMPRKNYFLNLSRTGGVSVNCFRLPSQRGPAHHSRSFNPVHKLLAQEIKFLLEHNRETPLQIQSHPSIKTPVPQGLSSTENLLLFNMLELSIESLNQLPKFLSLGLFFRPGLVFQLQ